MRFSSYILPRSTPYSIMPKIIPQNEATSLLSWWSDHYSIRTLFCLLVLCPIIQKGLDNIGVHQIWNTTESNDFVVTLNLLGKISSDNPKLGCFLCIFRPYVVSCPEIKESPTMETTARVLENNFDSLRPSKHVKSSAIHRCDFWRKRRCGRESFLFFCFVFWSYLMGEIWFCVPKRIRVLKCHVMIWKWKRNPRNIIWIIQIINTRLITEK